MPRTRQPLVERVGLVLFVRGAVGQLDDAHPAVLVELARLRVSLEDPEPEPVRGELRDPLEEQAAGALAVELGVDVEVEEDVVAQREEAHDAPVAFGDPDLVVLGHDLADPRQHVLGAVDVGQIGHAFPPRAQVDVRERGRVLRGRSPERKLHEPRSRSPQGARQGRPRWAAPAALARRNRDTW